jgi:ribose transport system permease protein
MNEPLSSAQGTSEHQPDSGASTPRTATADSQGTRDRQAPARRSRLATGLIRYSGLVGIAVLVIVFTLDLPNLFFTQITLRTIIANQTITGFLALGALVPLAAGLIDLSFASVAGLSLVVTVWLSINTGWSIWLIVLVAIVASLACGLVSGALVALIKLDSLIVTLGMSSVVLGICELITASNSLYGNFPAGFTRLGQGAVGPVPYLTLLLVALAIVVWVWLEHTPAGRYTLATGSNPTAARLAGISVARTHLLSLAASSLIGGIGGVLLAAQVGNASTTIGPGYLLPSIAALFLGATQVRDRANVIGTLIAILLLGTGIKGLQLAGAATWVTDVFNGGVLILAITAAALRSRSATAST